MSKRWRISMMTTVAAMAVCGWAQQNTAAQTTTPKRRPNIVYFYADDLGYGETGPYGQKKIHTPNIDRLAAEGMKFTNHYSAAPLCSPARCSLLTGLHSGHSVVRFNYEFGGYEDESERGQMPLPPHTQTIATILQDAGYATGCVGKWGLGMTDTSGHPNRQGFDYFFGYLDQKQAHNYYPTHLWENTRRYPLNNEFYQVHGPKGDKAKDVDFAKYHTGDHACDHMTSKALAFLDDHKDQPFFLYYATTLPHLSLQPKPEFVAPYLKEFPDDPPYVGNRYAPSQHPRAAYAAMISMMDADLGAIMARLKELGLDDNTIIMFSSDNGPKKGSGVDLKFFNSTAGLRGNKHTVYEGGIREPMIARWPGHIAPGTTSDLISAQYDVLPTVCELLGLKGVDPIDGISFLPTLLGQGDQKKHDYLYWEIAEHGGRQALRKGPWKIVRTDVNGNPDTPWELYNLHSDAGEKHNAAREHPDIVKELSALTDEAHWHPIAKDYEVFDPKFKAKQDQ